MRIKKVTVPSMVPGVMTTEHRCYSYEDEPNLAGFVVLKRDRAWIGVRTWLRWRSTNV